MSQKDYEDVCDGYVGSEPPPKNNLDEHYKADGVVNDDNDGENTLHDDVCGHNSDFDVAETDDHEDEDGQRKCIVVNQQVSNIYLFEFLV